MTTAARSALALTGLAVLSACSGLLGPQAPLPVRWFEPALPAVQAATAAPQAPELRLAPVRGARHLRERVVVRRSDVEHDLHDLWRWSEEPAVTTERALAAALFETGRARRSTRADAPTLTVELVRFELSLDGDPHAVVAWRARIDDADGRTRAEASRQSQAPLERADPEELARVLGALVAGMSADLAEAWLAAP